MQKNDLLRKDETIIRILKMQDNSVFIINCTQKSMPKWINQSELDSFIECTEQELLQATNTVLSDMESLDTDSRRFVYEHYTMIAGILPFVTDEIQRSDTIRRVSVELNVSKQTIRNYLCLYLIYQNIAVFAPKKYVQERQLTKDEKNIRWALNKFFYTKNKNSLRTAYTMMLQAKYCDTLGTLLSEYPSFYQFRYYYRKHKSLQTYYISRNGLTNYQRNNRPLIGDNVQEFAPAVGVGMLDSTICDIYLVNELGNLVGRPILTACIDAYSSLCCGYSLTWEGGIYSLRNLMLNVVANKVEWCKRFGISIQHSEWNSDKLPAIFVTDKGAEYESETFEQIAELGVKVINLPAYRPELKGSVEKFFDLLQDSYKKHLKGKGMS